MWSPLISGFTRELAAICRLALDRAHFDRSVTSVFLDAIMSCSVMSAGEYVAARETQEGVPGIFGLSPRRFHELRAGGGASPFQRPACRSPSRKSRSGCLSKLGCDRPGLYPSSGQNRELSGVRTSSIRVISPHGLRPNSNFVSAMMMPLLERQSRPVLVDRPRHPLQLLPPRPRSTTSLACGQS